LPNHLFEELATDVYDEVDRRETESSKLIFIFKAVSIHTWTERKMREHTIFEILSASATMVERCTIKRSKYAKTATKIGLKI
jgi:hypothetical protein